MLAVSAACFAHCETPGIVDCDPLEAELSLLSYNLANRTGAEREQIVEILESASPDFMALQECLDCDELEAVLPARFALSDNRRAGVSIMFDESRWMPMEQDLLVLGNNDDGWGERVMHWARFREVQGGADIVVASTHYCVPIRNEVDECSPQRLIEYAQRSVEHIASRVGEQCPILFAGDLNVFGELERSAVGEVFADAGFNDVFALAPFEDSDATFMGNSWAPQARLDFVFARFVPNLRSASVERGEVAASASDHFPLYVEVGAALSDSALR